VYDVTLLPCAQKTLLKLPMTLYAAVVDALEDLENYGADLQEPLVRYVGKGLREIRVTSRDGLGKASYFFMKGRRIYVVHILHKKMVADLKAMRIAESLTQDDIARRTGLKKQNISRLENGVASPTLTTISRYAVALGGTFEFKKLS
jgi:phage-related protein